MKEIWPDWIANRELEHTKTGNKKLTPYEQVATWVSHIKITTVTGDMTLNGFKECGYIKFHINFGKLHAWIRNIGDTKEAPKVIVKINELLVEREEMIDQFLKVDTSEPKEVESMDEAENVMIIQSVNFSKRKLFFNILLCLLLVQLKTIKKNRDMYVYPGQFLKSQKTPT